MVDKKTVIRRLSFAAYFISAFLLFLLLLFPFDRFRAKLESEVRSRTPFELSVARISPRFFDRFVLIDVVVSDKKNRVLFESAWYGLHEVTSGILDRFSRNQEIIKTHAQR